MTLCPIATLEPAPDAEAILAVLAKAIGQRGVDARRRMLASSDGRNPDEGLALLEAYVAVADTSVRQAILDALIAIAGTNPYRHVRRRTTIRNLS